MNIPWVQGYRIGGHSVIQDWLFPREADRDWFACEEGTKVNGLGNSE